MSAGGGGAWGPLALGPRLGRGWEEGRGRGGPGCVLSSPFFPLPLVPPFPSPPLSFPSSSSSPSSHPPTPLPIIFSLVLYFLLPLLSFLPLPFPLPPVSFPTNLRGPWRSSKHPSGFGPELGRFLNAHGELLGRGMGIVPGARGLLPDSKLLA